MDRNGKAVIDLFKRGIVVGFGVALLVLAGINLSHAADWTGFLNINTAQIEDLLKLPGMNQDTAHNIVAYRETQGAFTSPEDLIHVDGFSYEKIDALRPYIKVEGTTTLAETHSARLMRNMGALLKHGGY